MLPGLEDIDFDLSHDTMYYLPEHITRHAQDDHLHMKSLLTNISKIKEETELRLKMRYETKISMLKKRILELENSLDACKQQYYDHKDVAYRLAEEHRKLTSDKQHLLLMINQMSFSLEEQKRMHNLQLEQTRTSHDSKIEMLAKEYVLNEIDFKAKISKLQEVVKQYHDELNQEREKFNNKKEELKRLL